MKVLVILALTATLQVGYPQLLTERFMKGLRQFTGDMYFYIIYQTQDKNVIFSPMSITQALGMTLAGAKNNTKQEIKNKFSLSNVHDQLVHFLMGVVFNQYTGQSETPKTVIANAMFLQDKYQVKPNFKNTLIDRYKTDIFSVDFLQPQHASDRINNWVSRKTQNLIQNLVHPSMFDQYTRLAVLNSIYFKAVWRQEFTVEKEENLSAHNIGATSENQFL